MLYYYKLNSVSYICEGHKKVQNMGSPDGDMAKKI